MFVTVVAYYLHCCMLRLSRSCAERETVQGAAEKSSSLKIPSDC